MTVVSIGNQGNRRYIYISILLYSVAYHALRSQRRFFFISVGINEQTGHDDDEELMVSEPANVPLALGKE